jgi:Lrp/AsnC family transcriptional regulator, regulator for asnA, asnC and gidA
MPFVTAPDGRGTKLLDDTSKAIIAELQTDGRMPYAAIGKAVGLSEAAVRSRVQRLIDAGIMDIVAVTDPLQLGFARQAMVGLRVASDPEPVAEKLSALPEVDYLVVTAGSFDILAEVVCEDDEHLLEVVNRQIRTLPEVTASETFVYLKLAQADLLMGSVMMTITAVRRRARRGRARARGPRHLWMHFTRHSVYEQGGHVPVIVRGEGAYIWDDQGKRYLDGLAGLFVVQAGHGRTEIARGRGQAGRAAGLLPAVVLRPPRAIELAERLAALRPRRPQPGLLHHRRRRGGRDRLEAGQAVLQADRQADQAQGDQPLVAYHGTPQGALSITGIPAAKAGLRAAGPGRPQGAQHQLLPGTRARRRPQGVRALGRRPDRGGHRVRGPGHRRRGLPRAGAELRRLLPARHRATSSGCARSATSTTCCSSPTRPSAPSAGSATTSR